MRKKGRKRGENIKRKEQVERSAVKRIKCSLCSQETYGAPANSKSDTESFEVRAAKRE